MSPFISEFVGTAALVLVGNCAAASVLLARSRGENSGWLALCAGWAFAMFVAVWVAVPSGAHLNPAVTASLAATGELREGTLLGHVIAQLIGAIIGAVGAVLVYLPHWRLTHDPGRVQACLCSPPGVRAPLANLLAIAGATFIYVFLVHMIIADPWQVPVGFGVAGESASAEAWRSEWWAFSGAVATLFGGLMLALGGSTGGSMNPARDIAGRAVHALLPLPGKAGVDWGYAWVPVVAPLAGALAAAFAVKAVGL